LPNPLGEPVWLTVWEHVVDLCGRENWLVAKGYRPVDRGQVFLLPPDMAEWLPEDHLAWFVIDTVAAVDTRALHARAAARRDGTPARSTAGRAGYDPDLLLTLLIYGYALGERSSRRIERLCHTDVAFRVICAGDPPDHTVIARFRQTHEAVFVELFVQVLRLCRAAGLARLGTVAIDGTKIAANASRQANRSPEWLATEAARLDQAPQPDAAQPDAAQPDAGERVDRERVEAMVEQAERVDAAEGALFGAARGDELPASWAGREGRRERIRAAQARLQAQEQAKRAAAAPAAAEAAAARAERDKQELAAARAALAAEVTARQAARDSWERQWEVAMTTRGAPLPRGAAPKPVEESVDVRRARERVDRAQARVAQPDTAPRAGRRGGPGAYGGRGASTPRANTTDPDSSLMPGKNGWVQGYNTQLAVTDDQVILGVQVNTNPVDIVSFTPMVDRVTTTAAALHADHELGTLLFDAGYCSQHTLTAPGPDRLIATGKTRSIRQAARQHPTTGPPPEGAAPREAMDHRLRTPEGAKLYTRRGATVEPGIGNFKKLLDRFSRRGLAAVTSEAHLTATAFNLLKIYRAAHR
jgi:transposase